MKETFNVALAATTAFAVYVGGLFVLMGGARGLM